MKGSSAKLPFLTITIILASACLPFRRTIGLGAKAQTYGCKNDADCETQCDPEGCLELPSRWVDGICACPFGPEHSAYKTLPRSTCITDVDSGTVHETMH